MLICSEVSLYRLLINIQSLLGKTVGIINDESYLINVLIVKLLFFLIVNHLKIFILKNEVIFLFSRHLLTAKCTSVIL